ncbi:GNAT family N-acetyltransferase [Pseudanabaena sp. PCC 6802]|uniref:GNAT family N-acetyltransferase n=1 Tax=Pseudanabaena sp. PCC 6802 TaxID=118173 RepID=UPI00034D3F68|nr:GNAT family N-acetyltransferase [Pseudanabaena sp. PCC 6802]
MRKNALEIPLDIRCATSADLPLLQELYADMDAENPLPAETIAELFDAIAMVPNYFIYLAFQESGPVGTFSLLYVPTMMHRGYHKYAILDAVTVRSDRRGQGIGAAMMRAAIQLSAEAGCYKVALSSNLKRDRAHEFYRSLGFKQHGWSFKCVLSKTKMEV